MGVGDLSMTQKSKPLKEEEIAGLFALYHACDGSIHARIPIQAFRSELRKPYDKEAKRILKKLIKRGFVHRHPGRSKTYGITKLGIRTLRELGLIP